MNTAITRNDEGAAFLRASNYNAAIAAFTSGLDTLRALHDQVVVHSEPRQPSLFPSLKSYDAATEVLSEAGDAIYNHAFALTLVPFDTTRAGITDDSLQDAVVDQADVHCATAIFLFNLGLSYHLRSTIDRDSSRFLDLKCARRLYEVGMKVVGTLYRLLQDAAQPWIPSLMFVLGNNLGCIAVEEYDYDMVDRCIEWTHTDGIPLETPSILLNHISWESFKSHPAAAA